MPTFRSRRCPWPRSDAALRAGQLIVAVRAHPSRLRATDAEPRLLPLDDSLLFKLVRIVNLAARPFNEHVGRAHRITLTEWRVMIVLASRPGCAAQEVALHTGLDKMSVSRALAGLGRAGRIARRADPDDKRRDLCFLTVAGEELYERIGAEGSAQELDLFAAITPADQDRLGSLLDKLIARRLDPETAPPQ